MSEEAIIAVMEKMIKHNIGICFREEDITYYFRAEEVKAILNYIDKLQKENEKLKELVGFTTIRIKTDDIKMLTKDFISKDKIRNKIKELEEWSDVEEYFTTDIQEILEELLN